MNPIGLAKLDLDGALVPKLATSARCALCEASFQVGDEYVSIWPKQAPWIRVQLGITVHRGCFHQLATGDLSRIFAALEHGLALPLHVLRHDEFTLQGARP